MTEIKTGSDAVRAALRQRSFKGSLALIARDCHADVGSLDAFMRGTGKLPVDTLKALARFLFDADYDPEADRLRNANKQVAVPLGVVPGPCKPGPAWTPGARVPGPQPVKPEPSKPRATRPGWAE